MTEAATVPDTVEARLLAVTLELIAAQDERKDYAARNQNIFFFQILQNRFEHPAYGRYQLRP